MELELPPSEDLLEKPVGMLRLERGEAAGRIYRLRVRICPNPLCECKVVSLYCLELLLDSDPPSAGATMTLDLNWEHRTVEPAKDVKGNPDAILLGKAVAEEITDADWQELAKLYLEVKQSETERADFDRLEASFPSDVLADDGSLVGYYAILPYARPIQVEAGGRTWLFDDQYCVQPECHCHDCALSFFLIPSAKPNPGDLQASVAFRYDYRTGKTERLISEERGTPSIAQFVEALRAAQPDPDAFLAKRHDQLRQLFRRALARSHTPIRRQTPKVGRNEPCPCGSGKKFKHCCGKN